ncbi:MAG: glycosyltransferase family 2 protein [Silicimonas sp.]|nr:glycosyltransferase family 2 protein [Silicimonas sp.]
MCHHADIVWLERWIRHHRKFVRNQGDLVLILDGQSDELDEAVRGCSVIRLSLSADQRSDFDRFRMLFINRQINALLRVYKYVVHTDADEMIVLHPDRGDDLVAYLDARAHTGIALSPVGVELLFSDDDPPLDPDLPLLRQRQFGFLSEAYCKPCIIHREIGRGHMHMIRNDKWTIDKNLFLFHGKYADQEIFNSRLEDRHNTKEAHISKRHAAWDRNVARRWLNRATRRFMAAQEEPLTPEAVAPRIAEFERSRSETGKFSFEAVGRFRVPDEMRELL